MIVRFTVELSSGALTRYHDGVVTTAGISNVLVAGDSLSCELVLLNGGSNVTDSVLSDGKQVVIGLRSFASEGVLLAQSSSHVKGSGVVSCTLNLNTVPIVALMRDLCEQFPYKRLVKSPVLFEVVLYKDDISFSQTLSQSTFMLCGEVSTVGTEEPTPVESVMLKLLADAKSYVEDLGTVVAQKAQEAFESAQAASAVADSVRAELASYSRTDHVHSLSSLSDVLIVNPKNSDVLTFSNTQWKNQPAAEVTDGGNF